MEIVNSQEGGTSVVQLRGRLDGNTSAKVESAFNELITKGQKLFVFDFSAMEYISSVGLRVLLVAAKKLKAVKGRIVLSGLNDNVKEVFEMSGFHTIFEIFPSRHDAVKALDS